MIIIIFITNDTTKLLFIVTSHVPQYISAALRHCLYINAEKSVYIQTQNSP